jgi:hypothetical protein
MKTGSYLLSILSIFGIVGTCSPEVRAHAAATPLPLHHALLVTKPVLKFALPHHATTSTFLYHTPGASGATSAAIKLRNEQILAGYNAGGSTTIVQQITNGHIFGTSYYGTGPNQYVGGNSYGPPSYFALGSNPLNTGVVATGNQTIAGYNSTSFSLSPSQVFSKTKSGALLPFVKTPPVYQSAALRAIENQAKSYSLAGYQLGATQYTNLFNKNSIVGGELAGTYYTQNTASTYSLYGGAGYGSNFVFAFGNNPLNTLSSFSGTLVPSSYFLFSNGQRLSILGGQLAFTRLTQSSGSSFYYTGGRFLALGNSQYNNFLNATITPKQISYLQFLTSKH